MLDLPPGVRLLDLEAAGLPEQPEEEGIEAFGTFEENALAKARYFARRSGRTVIADDSGLRVDALGGAPGVRSKRFSGREDLTGDALDLSNNAHLLEALAAVPDPERTAHYVCVVAIATPDGEEHTFQGRVDGRILREPRGSGGFGYDPLFYLDALNATFAEVDPEVKNGWSHRARAVEAAHATLSEMLRARAEPSGKRPGSLG